MFRIVVVGGCGHVGLPLSITLAQAGHQVTALDIDQHKVEDINAGVMPFREEDAEENLNEAIASGRFIATVDKNVLNSAEVIIMVIGTPVDEHMNPDPHSVINVVKDSLYLATNCKLLMLRSTIYPGVTKKIEELAAEISPSVSIAFCPERILEGKALVELRSLPQIVGARNSEAINLSVQIFDSLGVKSIVVKPEEAEFAKLFTNSWRYIKFAAANEFYNMATEAGLDYNSILEAIKFEYPRASDIPKAGFAAGPCLLKDTMQLAAFSNNNFQLGNSAMSVNEGLPLRIVERLRKNYDLANLTVGILGMAFKAESDDTRASLSYKLKRILEFEAQKVLTTDPYVNTDGDLKPLEYVLENSDILILAAPHKDYANLNPTVPLIDTWGLLS